MRKLTVLAVAFLATLCFAAPAFAQSVEDVEILLEECQYSSEALPTAEDCRHQVQQSFEAAQDAAEAAVGAAGDTANISAGTADGTVNGEAAFRAALGAARETGVDEATAQAVATRAVASVSTGPEGAGKATGSGGEDRAEEKRDEKQRNGSDDDEITVLPATGGSLDETLFVPGVLALLVGAGLLARRFVR